MLASLLELIVMEKVISKQVNKTIITDYIILKWVESLDDTLRECQKWRYGNSFNNGGECVSIKFEPKWRLSNYKRQ